MRKVTARLPRQHITEIDDLVDDGEFLNRSEAIRVWVRAGLDGYEPPWKRQLDGGEEPEPASTAPDLNQRLQEFERSD